MAVLYFDPMTTDVDLQMFAKGLASLLITDFTSNPRLVVIERDKLEAVLAELKLGESRMANKGTFAKIGKLLGVEYLVTGSLMGARGQFKIASRIFRVEDAVEVASAKVTLDPNDIFGAEEQLVGLLNSRLVELGAVASVEPLAPKSFKLPLKTASTYSRALDAKDKKDKPTAVKLLGQVVKEQPDFKLAQLDLLSLTN
jgi:TolB-like protein